MVVDRLHAGSGECLGSMMPGWVGYMHFFYGMGWDMADPGPIKQDPNLLDYTHSLVQTVRR